VRSATALVRVFAERKESVSSAYTHTKAAGLLHFFTRDATWHDESGDRREQSVTKLKGFVSLFLNVPFAQQSKSSAYKSMAELCSSLIS